MICVTFQNSADGQWTRPLSSELDSPSTLVLIFGSPKKADLTVLLEEIQTTFPQSIITGCSTAGEIHGTDLQDDTLSVAVLRFENTELRLAKAPFEQTEDSRRAGNTLARDLMGDDLKAVFVLSEGTRVNGTELTNGLNEILADDVVVTGGLAGDGDRFEKTWVVSQGTLTTNGAVAVGFYGDHVQVNHAYRGGWDPFGPERLVTRSEGGCLYELDHKPALDIYKRYLGELADGLPGTALLFPLAIREAEGSSELVRTVLSVNHEEQSMTFAGDIPQGAMAQLMRGNIDRIIDRAGTTEWAIGEPNGDTLSVAISCVGRRLVLKHRTEEELSGVIARLPHGSHQIGFYSYGELAPVPTRNCVLHNQTITVTVFSESQSPIASPRPSAAA